MGPIRVLLCVLLFASIGSVTGGLCQRAYLESVDQAVLAHLPPGNSRGLYLLPEFLLAGAAAGGAVGLGFGLLELRQSLRRTAAGVPAEGVK
jgi:hypothetical protein